MNAPAVHRLNSRNVAGPGGSRSGRAGRMEAVDAARRPAVLPLPRRLQLRRRHRALPPHGEIEDPEQEEYFVGRLRQAGAHIMGRVTYEEMAKFWPSSDHPIAAPMNEIPQGVVSA